LGDEGERTAQLVTDALIMAIWRKGPDGLLPTAINAANIRVSSSSA
jgi:transposase InsO family protein